jgi:hypothetical protein
MIGIFPQYNLAWEFAYLEGLIIESYFSELLFTGVFGNIPYVS